MLARLEEAAATSRTIFAEMPPRIEYALTALGRSFLDPLQVLTLWAEESHAAVCKPRKPAQGQR